ncbi:hypothetical protein GOB44_08745 [Sinorhizobium meliloti]|nr:hypothetical protein [Sinorhizobium meliloti]MDW9746823.1 hypothetical protein [Sinorhizobium meliloti]
MYGNRVSKTGKRVSEAKMTSVALSEAKGWYAALMDAEFKGRGDREKAVRGRLADKTGVPESYLYRLQYKTREMKDIAGSAYRALMLAYDDMCLRNEEAAAKHRADRHALRKAHATADKRSEKGVGMGEASN